MKVRVESLLGLFLLVFNFSYSAPIVFVSGSDEVEVSTLDPGQVESFSVTLENTSAVETAVDIEPEIRLSQYSFLGGTYPGIGGDCDTALAPGQTCTIFLETTANDIGDRDDYLDFNYARVSFFGEFPPPREQHDIKIDGYSYPMSCSLSPQVENVINRIVVANTTETVILQGFNFSPSTTVNVAGLSVSNLNISNFSELSFDVTGSATPGSFNITVSNECGNHIENNAVNIIDQEWIDLTTSAGVAQLGVESSGGEFGNVIIDPNFGVQFDVTNNQTWDKAIRFNGFCDSVDSDFDIIIYRSGTTKRLLVSLFGQNAQIDPYVGALNFRKQYIGLWNFGTGITTIWGSEGGEGGQNWNDSWGNVSTQAGRYYRFHYQNAGQAGSNVEVWEVDSSFNDITQLGSWVSTKPATPSNVVCPGISPFDGGLSDYYVAGIRVQ